MDRSHSGADVDELDVALLDLLDQHPRMSVLELARRLDVARGTAQARLDKLQARGVIRSLGPELDPVALGYEVIAFVTIETDQRDLAALTEHLVAVPQVIEAHTTSGRGDLLVKVAGRTNADLQQVLTTLLDHPSIERTSTAIVLQTLLAPRTLPLAAATLEA
ncbi:MAG: Lrp/AsnC family transcriptional regulator [Actinomycetota bacterium]